MITTSDVESMTQSEKEPENITIKWELCYEWMEQVLNRHLRTCNTLMDFIETIFNGILLNELLYQIDPKNCPMTNLYVRQPGKIFQFESNLNVFIEKLKNVFEMEEKDLFDPKEMLRLESCQLIIWTLSRLSHCDKCKQLNYKSFPPKLSETNENDRILTHRQSFDNHESNISHKHFQLNHNDFRSYKPEQMMETQESFVSHQQLNNRMINGKEFNHYSNGGEYKKLEEYGASRIIDNINSTSIISNGQSSRLNKTREYHENRIRCETEKAINDRRPSYATKSSLTHQISNVSLDDENRHFIDNQFIPTNKYQIGDTNDNRSVTSSSNVNLQWNSILNSCETEKAAQLYNKIVTDQDSKFIINDPSNQYTCILSDQLNEKDHCINEIVKTEKNYVDAMDGIKTSIIDNLTTLLNERDVTLIFDNFTELLLLNKRFLPKLRSATEPTAENTIICKTTNTNVRHVSRIEGIANLFLEYRKDFLVYAQYCSNISNAHKHIDKLMSNDSVKETIRECERKYENGKFNLKDIIALPMQRLLRYKLLLDTLKKHTKKLNSEHFALDKLTNAIRSLQDVNKYANEYTRDAEIEDQIRDIQKIIKYPPSVEPDNLLKYGKLIRDEFVKTRRQKPHVFLFEKAFIVTCSRTKEFKQLISMKTAISKTNMEQRKLFSKDLYELSLSDVNCRDNPFVFIFKSSEARKIWLNAIKETILQISPTSATINSHEFQLETVDRGKYCQLCDRLVCGLITQGYNCEKCLAIVHRSCLEKFVNKTPCIDQEQSMQLVQTTSPPPLINHQQSVEMGRNIQTLDVHSRYSKHSIRTICIEAYGGEGNVMSLSPNLEMNLKDIVWKLKPLDHNNNNNNRRIGPHRATIDDMRRNEYSFNVSLTANLTVCSELNLHSAQRLGLAYGFNENSNMCGYFPESASTPQISPAFCRNRTMIENMNPIHTNVYEEDCVEDNDLSSYSWFHDCNRDGAIELLKKCENGNFLIRKSSNNGYALSILWEDEIQHIIVHCKDGDVYITENVKFTSIAKLVDYYCHNSLEDNFPAVPTCLKLRSQY
ncbi:hypothetical protein SNEBB_011291 [Seison nebaliae]|nr:hypothetical protein SNEBB_011291 [Seison nebaliae]